MQRPIEISVFIEEEWNKMLKEFILKPSKSFRRCIDMINEKNNGGHIEKIYCFVSIFLFCCLFLKLKLILFYNWGVYYYTRIFLILLPHPVFLSKLVWSPSCHGGVMVKAMDCGIVVSEFVLQSRYYVHFRTNTLGKGMNPLILPAIG